MHKFADSLFTISGSFVNIDGVVEHVDNKYFKNLSRELQHQFLKLTTIHVTELVGLKSSIFSLFVAIHEGMPLNHMEILNAFPSHDPIAFTTVVKPSTAVPKSVAPPTANLFAVSKKSKTLPGGTPADKEL